MEVKSIVPWESPDWDRYVAGHPAGTVYHTSVWCSIVKEVGRYTPVCLAAFSEGRIGGVLALMLVRSALTGNRIVGLPFSDSCYPLADDPPTTKLLVDAALALQREYKVKFLELRGCTQASGAAGALESLGFAREDHFKNYIIPLSTDTDALKKTFHRRAVRQAIDRSFRRGLTVRAAAGPEDIDDLYRLYAMNRRRHGVPPQPKRLFVAIFERMKSEPEAKCYMAENEGRAVGAEVVFRFSGVTYGRYQALDSGYRGLAPGHALLWKAIEDAALSGDRAFDLGRTAVDDAGLNEFKGHWGTRSEDLPYFFCPPAKGLSVVKAGSLKYRLFTGLFKRLPLSVTTTAGARMFRHFG